MNESKPTRTPWAQPGEKMCGETSLFGVKLLRENLPYICNLPIGHEGDHEAWGTSETSPVSSWSNVDASDKRLEAADAIDAMDDVDREELL